MSVSKYVSEVKTINHKQEVVFNFLSDFRNLSIVFNEYTLAQLSQQLPGTTISDFNSDADHCHFTISKLGEVGFRILEKEFPKMIKITGEGKIPFEIFLWIQILPVTPYQSKMRLTLHADLNMMMKMMIGKKMAEGVNKMADALSILPYR